ncbi:hypothetical protein BT93_H2337 [Corymbia citriodora subsp. variegata]|nr:hypothetical protein BT93_H2337 [Corymbia citriodora subsp. variegata]
MYIFGLLLLYTLYSIPFIVNYAKALNDWVSASAVGKTSSLFFFSFRQTLSPSVLCPCYFTSLVPPFLNICKSTGKKEGARNERGPKLQPSSLLPPTNAPPARARMSRYLSPGSSNSTTTHVRAAVVSNFRFRVPGWLMRADGVRDCAGINELRVDEFRDRLDPVLGCPGNEPSEDALCWFGAIVGGLTSLLRRPEKETGSSDLMAKFVVLCSELVVLSSEFL